MVQSIPRGLRGLCGFSFLKFDQNHVQQTSSSNIPNTCPCWPFWGCWSLCPYWRVFKPGDSYTIHCFLSSLPRCGVNDCQYTAFIHDVISWSLGENWGGGHILLSARCCLSLFVEYCIKASWVCIHLPKTHGYCLSNNETQWLSCIWDIHDALIESEEWFNLPYLLPVPQTPCKVSSFQSHICHSCTAWHWWWNDQKSVASLCLPQPLTLNCVPLIRWEGAPQVHLSSAFRANMLKTVWRNTVHLFYTSRSDSFTSREQIRWNKGRELKKKKKKKNNLWLHGASHFVCSHIISAKSHGQKP